jgi:hypothetical protein
MLRSDGQIRFTSGEIEGARRLGIDLTGVKTVHDYSDAVIRLITTLEHERPDLLEKIAHAIAGETGRTLPARLTFVR